MAVFRVLYVDDEPQLLELGKLFLEQGGQFTVDTIASAPDALRLLKTTKYDAIIADYQMPKMNGIDFLKEVRRSGNSIPFILFTGRGREEVVIQALNEGADSYLQKGGDPVPQFIELSHKVRQAIQKRMAEGQLQESEDRYRTLIEHADEAVLVIQNGRICFANPKLREITGYSTEEFVEKPFLEYVHADDRANIGEQHKRRLSGEVLKEHYTFRILSKGGSVIWNEIRSSLISWNGRTAVLVLLQDITERRKAEEALRESEGKFRAAVDQSIDGIIIVDFTGKLLFANNSVAQFTGYELDVVGKLNVLDIVSPEFHLQAMSDFALVAAGTDSYPMEYKIIGAGKKELWIECIAKKITYAGSSAVMLSIRDLSKRHLAEKALRTREEFFREITENLTSVFYVNERGSNKFVYVSPAYEKVWMQSRQTLYDNPYAYLEAVHPDDRPRLEESIRGELEDGLYVDMEYRIIRPDGTVRWIHSRNFPVIGEKGTVYRVAGTAEDITDLRNSRLELHESEERFRSFIEQSLEGVSIVDEEGRIIVWNTAQEHITGIARNDALGVCAWDLAARMMPDEHRREELRSRMMESIQVTITSGTSAYPEPVYYRFIRPDGTLAVARQTVFVIKTSHGHMIGTLNQDVTEQQHAETLIKESEEKFRSLVEYALESISIIDFSGKGLFANRATARLLELDEDTPLSGRSVMEFLSRESQKDVMEDFTRAMGGKDAYLTQYTITTAKGNTMYVECIGKVISYEGKPAILLSIRDITGRKKAEDALRSANRQLNLLNGLTRHDILNKISVILGFLKITQMKTSDPAIGEYLKKINAATTAIKSQIEFTRVYQDLGTHDPQWLALDTVMPRAFIPSTITLNEDGKGIQVLADPMLEKVFFNLLDNSVRHGQRVTEIRVSAHQKGNRLIVIWEDNGVGIASDNKEQIFERGFGKNTGLGMFLAREILALTGITITETGEPGKGARFEILVPEGAYRVARE
jgi:PAS domain S-box-containing protein